MKILVVLLFEIVFVVHFRARASCVNLTSTVDAAGDPGPGSEACLPYSVDVSALAGMISVSEANVATTVLAPAMDVSVVVDESGSVKTLCSGTLDCYNNERHFAMDLVTLLNAEVGLFGKGGTALYMEYSSAVNVNAAFSSEADYLEFVGAQTHDGGGTYIGTAIAEAKEALLALPGRENRSQIMVVITDGYEGGNTDPAAEAALAAEAGITMYVVAVDVTSTASPTCDNSDFWPSCVDEATLLQVAGASERLFVVDTFESITDTVLRDVLAGIGIPCATGATLSMELDKEPIAVVVVSSGQVEISDTTITWTMDSVEDTAAMTFVVDYCQCEHQRTTVDFIASATYTDDEMNEPNLLGLLDLTAQVSELCPTPGPSTVPTPTPTPTISPTAGATNSSRGIPFFPTPAPIPFSITTGEDSSVPWYEQLSIVLPAVAGLGGAATIVWAFMKGFCCCFCRKAAVGPGEKKKVKCPACGHPVWVAHFSLQNEARCSCDVLRERAEASARGRHAGSGPGREEARGNVMSEGFNKRVLSRLDPQHASQCVHCGIAFCAPCDVRDTKRAFPFLCENNRGRKEGETRAPGPSRSESGKAKQMWSLLRGQRKRIKVEPGPPDEKHGNLEVQTSDTGGAHEGGADTTQGGSTGTLQEEIRGITRENNGQRDGDRHGPRQLSMPGVVVQRPPIPFSNGPYPEALPSELGKQKQGNEKTQPARTPAREDEEEGGGVRKEEHEKNNTSGRVEERPGGWSSIWRSFRTAIFRRK